jgi:DNA polymerase
MLERTNREAPNTTAASGHDGEPHVLIRDYETRGVLALNKVGAHRYAADPRTEVLCCAYAVDDGPVKLWTPGDAIPPEFVEAANNPNWLVVAHNAHFEMAIEQHILGPRFGWPLTPIERQRCTMVMALALSLPAKLDAVARALELRHQKDSVGHRLMLMMAKPRKPHKDEDPNGIYWFDDQDRLGRLYEYCQADLESERELFARLPPLSPSEQALWILDATINRRGFCIDRSLAEAARKIAQAAGPEIDSELAEVTGGAVTTVNQVAKFQVWLQQNGCIVKDLQRKTVVTLLESELPPKVQRALELRQDGGQAAVKKINTLLQRAGADSRVRGALQFHKASTGRWAGEGFQPQNLKKPQEEDLEAAIAAVATGAYEHVRGLYPRALSLLGDLGRSLIVAAPGHTLIGADFSAIESRVLAWVGSEQWKLDVYSRYDATQDPRDEPYCILACRMLHVPDGSFTSESPERKIGKTADLACGYMGGAGAIEKFAPGVFDEAKREQIKTEWRAAHPNVVNFWYEIDRAAWAAVQNRGGVIRCGPVAFRCVGAFLFLKLPSGRKLAYPIARTKLIDPQRGVVLFTDNSAGRWHDCRDGRGAYGGVWTENVVQAISRDLLADAMQRVEAAGYPIVLTVHDEIVAEVPEGFGSTEEFARIMTRAPSWALTLPIAVKAWTGSRFG